jgi:hypothetical protein
VFCLSGVIPACAPCLFGVHNCHCSGSYLHEYPAWLMFIFACVPCLPVSYLPTCLVWLVHTCLFVLPVWRHTYLCVLPVWCHNGLCPVCFVHTWTIFYAFSSTRTITIGIRGDIDFLSLLIMYSLVTVKSNCSIIHPYKHSVLTEYQRRDKAVGPHAAPRRPT